MMDLSHYSLLAGLFDYPDGDTPKRVSVVQDYLNGHYPEAAFELISFADLIPNLDLNKMEELFTRSFDVQAVTTLDIGYVLFGDDYKRGELLVNLNREHKTANNDCHSELADHLPTILRLLPKLKDEELIYELVDEIIAPALRKMMAEFDPNRVEKKNVLYKKHYKTLIDTIENYATIYSSTLKSLYEVLKKDFSLVEKVNPVSTVDFLKSVDTEITIENTQTNS
jgi:nitrate reductase assembly molybdenum cofactor insertion protein NarJ